MILWRFLAVRLPLEALRWVPLGLLGGFGLLRGRVTPSGLGLRHGGCSRRGLLQGFQALSCRGCRGSFGGSLLLGSRG